MVWGFRRPAARVVLLDKEKQIFLVKGSDPMRPEKGTWWEIPGGGIEPGEKSEDAARRECLEETGCKVKKLENILSYFPAPGSSESYYHLYLGEIDSFVGEKIFGHKDENEDILVKSYDVSEVKDLLNKKKIINGLTLIALQWFFLQYYKD